MTSSDCSRSTCPRKYRRHIDLRECRVLRAALNTRRTYNASGLEVNMKYRAGTVVLIGFGAIALLGASNPNSDSMLNPLVTSHSEPAGAVPAECEQGLAAAATPRLDLADVPAEIMPASLVA